MWPHPALRGKAVGNDAASKCHLPLSQQVASDTGGGVVFFLEDEVDGVIQGIVIDWDTIRRYSIAGGFISVQILPLLPEREVTLALRVAWAIGCQVLISRASSTGRCNTI